jgi:RNA polymerase sigma factor (sigma-70 family)
LSRERYLLLRQPGVKDMHNTELLMACKADNLFMEEFLKLNKDFIFSIIIKYKGNVEELKHKFRVSEEEVLQHAFIGVISALRDFDFERGVKFTTYVVRPILWEINQLLYNDSRLVRLSRGAIEIIKRMKEVEDTLGYAPTEEELAQILDVPVERIREIIRFTKELEHIDGMDNFELQDLAMDSEDAVVNRIYVEQLLKQSTLNEFEMQIVELIMEGLNNSQVAERLKVYPMTINRAITRIRNKIQNSELDDKRTSKYEKEIDVIAEEINELKSIIQIDDMQDLLECCGYDTSEYTPRILYYIRQKAISRADETLEVEPILEDMYA